MSRDALLGAPRGADLIPAEDTITASGIVFAEPRLLAALKLAPLVFVLTCFFATFFVGLFTTPGIGARGYQSLFGQRFEIDPDAARAGLTLFAGVLALALLSQILRILHAIGSRSLTFRSDGVLALFGGQERFMTYDSLVTPRATYEMLGARVRLDATMPSYAFFAAQAAEMVALLDAHGVAVRASPNLRASARRGPLPGSETVLWEGRPSWQSFVRRYAAGLILSAIPVVAYIFWLWRIWVSPSPIVIRMFWTTFSTSVVGLLALWLLAMAARTSQRWLVELFGTIVITPRRIAWLRAGSRVVERDIAATEIIEANIVEDNGARGWIALITHDRRGAIVDVDLRDIPDAPAALEAIGRMSAAPA